MLEGRELVPRAQGKPPLKASGRGRSEGRRGDDPRTGGPILVGWTVLVLFFGAFVGWAGFVPLSSAAIAPGVVGVDGNRKTVQHLEGGIIRELLVREGDAVRAGQVLLELDDTAAAAELEALKVEEVGLQALLARLEAERDGAERVSVPVAMIERAPEAAMSAAVSAQGAMFEARAALLRDTAETLARQAERERAEAEGLKGELASQEHQLAKLREQLEALRPAVAQGFVTRARFLELEREEALLDGERSRNEAAIRASVHAVAGFEAQIREVRSKRADEVATQLAATQERLRTVQSQARALSDKVRRSTVTAPIAGTVVNLQVFTVGGVLAPGAAVMDIVPRDSRLVVEARLEPKDRDVVDAGQPAAVRLTAFSRRSTDALAGEVLAVSADRLLDATTNTAYYRTLVALEPDEEGLFGGKRLHPGMQAEVLITGQPRTVLSYLVQPVTRSLTRAFREE